MTQPAQLLANMLTSGARALAGFAVAEAAADDAELRGDRPEPSFDGWQDLLATLLADLAAAVAADRPQMFVQQVLWTKAALKARGVPDDFLRARLEALDRVLKEQLPGDLAPLATAPIRRSRMEFDGEPAGLTPRLSAGTAEEQLAAKYLVAILEGNRRDASRLILDAADAGQNIAQALLAGPATGPRGTGPHVGAGRNQRGRGALCHRYHATCHGTTPGQVNMRPVQRQDSRSGRNNWQST